VGAAPDFRLLGGTRGSALSGYSHVKTPLDAKSGVKDWVFHDLRRTCRTGMTRLGISTEHAEAALNHVSHRTVLERTYNVHRYEAEIVAALEAWQQHVAELVAPRLELVDAGAA
jgi:hypothetical protein